MCEGIAHRDEATSLADEVTHFEESNLVETVREYVDAVAVVHGALREGLVEFG